MSQATTKPTTFEEAERKKRVEMQERKQTRNNVSLVKIGEF